MRTLPILILLLATAPARAEFEAIRFTQNPIIHPGLAGLEGELGENINGPSLIRVPAWVEKPLGRYYLYFAHHHGKYIRMAYADRLEGPWKIHEPGVLPMKDAPGRDHIASPDVHVDDAAKQIRMYFHQPPARRSRAKGQQSYLAVSKDGLAFTAHEPELGHPYLRAFRYRGATYAFAKRGDADGAFLRSRDGIAPFEEGSRCLPGVRHSALWVEGDTLYLLYTIVGEAPERISLATVDLSKDWRRWKPSAPQILLEPEMDYEGVKQPLVPSEYGASAGPVRQLRDPAVFAEDGRRYLLYSVAGERGIAIAELRAVSAASGSRAGSRPSGTSPAIRDW